MKAKCKNINEKLALRGASLRFLGLAALLCGAFPFTSTQTAFADELNQITIGLLSDMTGSNGPNGDACRQGYELARKSFAPGDRAGGHQISFEFGDHKGEPKTGVTEFLRVTKQQNAVAVLSNRGNVGMAMDPFSARGHVPLIGIMGHNDFIKNNPYGFRFWPSPDQEGRALAEMALKVGKKVASVAAQDEYIASVVSSFEAELKKGGGEMVMNDTIGEQDTDWGALLLRIRSAKAEVLFLNAPVAKLGALVRRARELGVTQPIISNFWLSYPAVAQAAGPEAIEGAGYVTLDTDKPQFTDGLKKQFPDPQPNGVSYACYSGLTFLLQNIDPAEKTITSENLYQHLLTVSSVRMSDGDMPIQLREAKFKLVFQTYRNGKPGPATPVD